MPTIPVDLNYYAEVASQATGLDKEVVLTQWISENGWEVPSHNNFGNIRDTKNGGFMKYMSPYLGAMAYADLINKSGYYKDIRAATGGSVTDQLKAIINSPWDAGHYTDEKPGDKLYAVFQSVTGATIADEDRPTTTGSTRSWDNATTSSAKGVIDWLHPMDSLQAFFWIILGVLLMFLGIYITTNPLADLSNAVRSLTEEKTNEST